MCGGTFIRRTLFLCQLRNFHPFPNVLKHGDESNKKVVNNEIVMEGEQIISGWVWKWRHAGPFFATLVAFAKAWKSQPKRVGWRCQERHTSSRFCEPFSTCPNPFSLSMARSLLFNFLCQQWFLLYAFLVEKFLLLSYFFCAADEFFNSAQNELETESVGLHLNVTGSFELLNLTQE